MLATPLVRALLVSAALGHLVTIPALALAPRWGILKLSDLLQALSPINARIVMVVLLTIQCVLVGSAVTVLWAREDILAGGRLAVATTACLALLWLARMVVQIWLYGPLFSPAGLRLLHWGLVLLFAFMGVAYVIACIHAARTLSP